MAYTPVTAALLRKLRREQGRPLRTAGADIGIHVDRLDRAAERTRAVTDELAGGIPATLFGIAPEVGSVWVWEPLDDRNRETVRVTAVTWDGYDCKVLSERATGGGSCCNDLTRWVEATVLVSPA